MIDNGKKHPAKLWQSKWLFHDRSDQPEPMQIIDLLHDIRFMLVLIVLINIFG